MAAAGGEWISQGSGRPPRLTWSFVTEAPLVALRYATESGATLAADEVGGLYHLDRNGKLVGLTRGPAPIRSLGWSDAGQGGVALVGEEKVYWFDQQLTFQGWIEHPEPVLSAALDAHGQYTAVSLSSCTTIIYDANRKVVRRFGTMQPQSSLTFLVQQPALLSVTEYGLLCCHQFDGEPLWQQQLYSNVGDMAVTGDGQTIYLACYSHGIQCHNGRGAQVGSYQVGGTVCRVAAGFVTGRLAAATVERHFYYIDSDGTVIWQATLPDDIRRLQCDPWGFGIVCGLQSGRIVRLDWNRTE
jgi:outer membrane protein assembly factor BamB